jgi:hypothetical protein
MVIQFFISLDAEVVAVKSVELSFLYSKHIVPSIIFGATASYIGISERRPSINGNCCVGTERLCAGKSGSYKIIAAGALLIASCHKVHDR